MVPFDEQPAMPVRPNTVGAADRVQVLASLLTEGDSRLVPVSLGQRRLWFVDRLMPGSVDYNVVWPLRLVGRVDVAVLGRAVGEVVARHEVLRSRFVAVDGEPVAVVAEPRPVDLRELDLSGLSADARAAEVIRHVREAGQRPFDLGVGPLTRWVVLRVSDAEFVLLVSAHHIVFDGWSGSVLLRELSVLYEAFLRGEGSPLPELSVQFADFALWEREWLAGEALGEQLGFWRGYLGGAPAVLDLPTDFPRPVRRVGGGDRERFEFPVGLSRDLAGLCRAEGATVFMGLLAGLEVVLGRYAGVDDVVVGSFVANRAAPELEELIGFFVNTVVFRGDLSGRPTFRELLGRVRAGALEVFAHQDVPFDRVVEELHPRRQAGAMPFVQVALVVQNLPVEASAFGDVVVESLPTQTRTAAFDLSFHVWPTESGALAGFVEFATDVYARESVARLVGHWVNVLGQVVADPDLRLDAIALPGPTERRALVAAATSDPALADSGHCLHDLFAAQVRERPDAIAASCAGRRLTYRELDDRATMLAHRLRRLGVGPEVLVGVCVERSLDSVVAVLGVLKAGGAYLPLDPENPTERLTYMLRDAGATTVVATAATRHLVPANTTLLLVDELPAGEPEKLPPADVMPDNLAYVIYTSGSTGRPKGVAVAHRCAVSRVHRPSYASIDHTDVMLHALALSFDVSVMEMFGALANGAELAILPGKALPERLEIFLPQARVTIGWLTAALYHAVVDTAGHALGGLRTLIAGGDQLSTSHTEKALRYLDPTATLVNGYGPTEAAIFAATHTMRPADGVTGRVPIGGPIPDTELHVFDPDGNLSPIGVPGELHIGGDCLARGYLGRPDLTAERFIPHPFAAGRRLYRTGDVVRRRPDHTIEFLGRVDHQVKVRGFRVELGEIEQRLRRHPGVADTVVVARPDSQDDHTLVAYVEQAPGAEPPSVGDLLAYLRRFLPGYMVPNAFVVLDKLPLNPNGKVDRAALPDPDSARPDVGSDFVPPRNPIEEGLAGIWADLLGLDRVGAHDDFFDLGGHSLLASRLVARVRRAFDRELALATFFAAPTVSGMAAALEASLRDGEPIVRPPLRRMPRSEPLPVSLGQRRLWFVDRLMPGSVDYNVVWPLRLVGRVDVAVLGRAVGEVVARHEVLRSRFVAVDGEPVTVIVPAAPVDVPIVDLSGLPVRHRAGEVARHVSEATLEPFDLGVGPLTRWVVLRVSDAEFVLLVSAHHIVFDGWSGSVLLRELSVLYEAFLRGEGSPLPELSVQFADFALWEREWLAGEALGEQLGFWRGYLGGAPAVLDLPTDFPRPVRRVGGGDRERFEFPVGLSRDLAGLCRAEGATVFMGLLAGLEVVLGRYAGVDDVVVGSFVANRAAPELEELIGFFVNTVVFRGDLSGRPTFRELLGRVRAGALEVFAHQDVPFDRVVEELHPRRQAGAMPFVQVALVVQNLPVEASAFGDVVVESLPTQTRTAAFDLSFHVWPTESGALAGFVEFATDVYARESVARLVGHWVNVLGQVVADPDLRLDAIALPGPTERHHLVHDVARGPVRDFGAQTLAERFAGQAARTPDAAAFVHGARTLTYRELDDRATMLARRLRRLGVGPETPVGVCLDHGLDLPAAALAVWKADAAYLPLDPQNPTERLTYMLRDAGATTVVTTTSLRTCLPDDLVNVVLLDGDLAADDDPLDDEPLPSARSTLDNLAAIIYTSGSTGRPKGVAVTGRSIVNRVEWFADECPFGPDDVTCMKTPIAFVDALWELLGGLLHGVPTVVIGSETGRDPKALTRRLAAAGVTRLLLVPTLLRMLLLADDLAERLPALRLWISSGEPLPANLARTFAERLPGRALHNLYGAAEGWDSLWPPACAGATDRGAVPVGRPLANVSAYVLDRAGHPAPVGVPGHLHVGGDCLARGYLGRPDLTAERFVPHPVEPGARLYRTGDLARTLPDGQIELIGRVDQQVKIRGFRVEPGEVERSLEALPRIRQAAVVPWQRSPDAEPELAAYVVADGTPTAADLRAALRDTLPSHLVPTSFTLLEALPSTVSGKVDRLALPRPVPVPPTATAEPADDAELLLAQLWAEVLEVPQVGIHDDFFDIGGHSLLAAQLVDRIGRDIGRELPVSTVFDHPTVHRMSRALRSPDTEGSGLPC